MRSFLAGLLLAGPLLPIVTAPAGAQTPPPDSARVSDYAEDALDDLERSAGDAEQLAGRLTALAEHPLDVNAASAGELARVPAFSPFAARNVVRERVRRNGYDRLADLRAAEGVTAAVLAQARPYLTAGPTGSANGRFPETPSLGDITGGMEFDVMQRYTRRLDLGDGYEARPVPQPDGDTARVAPFLGRPGRLYTRLRARYERRVSLALTFDKDPGERFTWDPDTGTYGYDHVSGHVAIHDFGRLKTLVAGDFTAEFGQGTLLWSSMTFGKGRNPVRSIARSSGGLDPYGSTEENRFFRGLGATVRLTSRLDASAFFSRRTLDATRARPDTSLPGVGPDASAQVTTLAESGLHRTAGELAKKDALGETLGGGALAFSGESFHIGAAGYHARFDAPLRPDTARLFRRFDFRGDRATAASVYAQVFAGSDYYFFGEAARTPGGAVGGVGGATATFSRFAEATVLARHYPRDFHSLHGYSFGERSGAPQNETGFYAGLRLKPARRWTLKGYFDLYRFPWVRFAVGRPSSGYDARLIAEHAPRDWLSWYVQLRSETREGGADLLDAAGRPLDGLIEETRQSARLHVDYRFSERLRLRSRIEGARYVERGPQFSDNDFGAQRGTDYGVILYQDVRFKPFDGLRLDARLAFFDTDSYGARVYAYENDLLYSFAVPAYSGTGRRFYLLARWAPTDRITLEAKYGATRFRGVETIGSGYGEIDGPRRRGVRAQVRFQF